MPNNSEVQNVQAEQVELVNIPVPVLPEFITVTIEDEVAKRTEAIRVRASQQDPCTVMKAMVESGGPQYWADCDILLNGRSASANDVVADGSVITIKEIGNLVPENITVRVVSPGKTRPVNLLGNSTVADALQEAGIDDVFGGNKEVRLNGKVVTNLDAPLQDNDTIFVMIKIKGNLVSE